METETQPHSIAATQRRAAGLVSKIKRADHVTSTTKLIEDLKWEILKARKEKRRLDLSWAMSFDEVAVSIIDHLSRNPTNIGQHNPGNFGCSTSFL